MNPHYEKLRERFNQISKLQNISSILGWDEAVIMPSGSSDSRNAATVELSTVIKTLSVAPEVGEWLAKASDDQPWDQANLREMNKTYLEATAVPVELNARLVLAKMESEQAWRKLRAANDWKSFLPYQQKVLDLTRESLGHLADKLKLSVYDSALSQYSPGLSSQKASEVFGQLKTFLPSLTERAIEAQSRRPAIPLKGRFPMAAQKELGRELMKALGFSFDHGRLDESHHPFCGGTARDVRITTRYDESDFLSALMGVLHETGHGLYEQHLPREWEGQPVGNSAGMSIHESQSLFQEMQICRSAEFMEFAAPLIQKYMGPYAENAASLTAENLTRLTVKVEKGLIRVDADEITYPSHIILRFELERDLIEGQLSLSDLPEAWNAKLKEYLGLEVKGDNRNGCMQDVHWPGGAFGYFPAYTFGAVIAAQLFSKIQDEIPSVRRDIARGEFSGIQKWLESRIWSQGSKLETLPLVESAVGKLTVDPFRKHLEARYL